ncbi:MAG: asparaginase [Acidimicrobiales bacterium]|nr:asparaginase [Acidimicrobiales bacterium]
MTIHLIATGGTISSHHDGEGWTELDGAALVGELAADLDVAGIDVEVADVRSGPSSNLSVDDMLAVAERVRSALAAGADGVVVTHGTDTIELTAFVTELVLGIDPDRPPVVFTGSMRVHSHMAPDGPTNMLDAIRTAAHPAAIGREVMVCLDGTLHAAARVSKVDAGSLDAFSSAPIGPIGAVRNGVPEFVDGAFPPSGRPPVEAFERDVPLVSCFPGMPADEVSRMLNGRRSAVLEVFGDLNVPVALWGPIHEAWRAGTLVVLASRAFTATSRNDGLDLLGAIGAGGLTAQKARLVAMAALGSCTDRDGAAEFVARHRLIRPPHDRSST